MIEIILNQLKLQTRWFKNAVDGIDEEDSVIRLNNKVNNLRWLAGHLVAARYRRLASMNADITPFIHIDKFFLKDVPPPGTKPFDELIEYPPLSECRQAWEFYSNPLIKEISLLTAGQLSVRFPFKLPIEGSTIMDVLAFFALHESFHIGQMAIIRKALGYPSMILS